MREFARDSNTKLHTYIYKTTDEEAADQHRLRLCGEVINSYSITYIDDHGNQKEGPEFSKVKINYVNEGDTKINQYVPTTQAVQHDKIVWDKLQRFIKDLKNLERMYQPFFQKGVLYDTILTELQGLIHTADELNKDDIVIQTEAVPELTPA